MMIRNKIRHLKKLSVLLVQSFQEVMETLETFCDIVMRMPEFRYHPAIRQLYGHKNTISELSGKLREEMRWWKREEP